jgi:UDP-glucose 4-epimerase
MSNYWKKEEEKMDVINKSILITGGSGHIGTSLVKKIISLYPKIYVLGRKSNPELDILIKKNKIRFIECDLADNSNLSKYKNILDGVNIVLHLAAHVPKSQDEDNLSDAIRTNLTGTINLIKSLKHDTQFIFISTCEVYGIQKSGIINENSVLAPLSYYGASKVAAEVFLRAYAKKNGIKLKILRLANVYGPGEMIDRAIPNFIKSVIKNKSPTIFGDGSDKRDFIYVEDVVNYIIAAMEKGDDGTYVIATGKSYTIKEVAKKIIQLSKSNVDIKFEEAKKIRTDYVFDVSKAKKAFGYTPKIGIDEGLLNEIVWFKNQNGK